MTAMKANGTSPVAITRRPGGMREAITGFADQPPVKAGATMCDMLGSVHLFAAILLALREREQTGVGRAVEGRQRADNTQLRPVAEDGE